MQNPPKFEDLAGIKRLPIGTIVRSLEHEVTKTDISSEHLIWAKFDQMFFERLDYCLWRHWFRGFYRRGSKPTPPSWTKMFPTRPGFPGKFGEQLAAAPLVEVWGVIGLIAWKGFDVRIPLEETLPAPVEMLECINATEFLTECPAHCAVAAMVASGKIIQRLTTGDSHERKLAQTVEDHVFSLRDWLYIVDPDFEFGGRVRFKLLEEEEQRKCRVIPQDHLTYVLGSLADIYQRTSTLCNIYKIGFEPGLAETNFILGYAAWRIVRTQLNEVKMRKSKTLGPALHALYEREMDKLRTAAFAAVAARNLIRSANLWWVYQTMFVHERPQGAHVEKWMFTRLHEVGLGIYEEFDADTTASYRTARNVPSWSPRMEISGGEGTNPERQPGFESFDSTNPPPVVRTMSDSFGAILHEHQSRNPSVWAPLQPYLDEARTRYLATFRIERTFRALAEAFDKKHKIPDQSVIASILEIAIHIDFVRTAVDMLKLLEKPQALQHLVPTVRKIALCTQINRLGLSTKRLNEWLVGVKQTWEKCAEADLFVNDRLAIHEVLLGRYATLTGNMSERAANLVKTERLAAFTVSPQNYVDVLQYNEDVFRLGPGILEPDHLKAFIRKHEYYPLGKPLVISLVTLDSGTSILSCGDDTGFKGKFYSALRLNPEAARLLAARAQWFAHPRSSPADQVRWQTSFRQLRDLIQEIARQNAGCRWILLAVEPHLTSLPWQHLMSYSLGCQENAPLVTIVPNMGWGPLAMLNRSISDSSPTDPLKHRICQSDDHAITSARESLGNLVMSKIEQPFSMGMTLGHGYFPADPGGLPTVEIDGKILDINDWLELSDREVLILHSCWSGNSANATPWADGALTVHLLNRICRAVIASVGSHPIEAMKVLQKSISSSSSTKSLGERYLDAINEFPAVSMYNIYGLASVPPYNGQPPHADASSREIEPMKTLPEL